MDKNQRSNSSEYANALVAVRVGLRLALAAAVGEEERPVGLLQERGAQIAQGAGCVAKAAGGLLERGVVTKSARKAS